MSLTPGERLGPYEVTTLIGVGGMGQVYRATDRNLRRQVAIKVLPESVAGDGERLARFQREAEVLAALNHPNIAIIYGLERANDRTALVMELVEGPTLADRITEGPIPADEAVSVAKQIAEALEAAHAQGIIHRDLKPANLKVRSDGAVKVLDFGLAKAIEPAGATPSNLSESPTITTPAMTQRGVILGTAAYMSPEQARGKSVDKRTDIWAFGCVLYEMLTGRRAFEGDDVADTIAAVVKSEPDWSVLSPGVPPILLFVLRRCLQKNPKHRIQDIADVRLALEDASASPVWLSTTGPGNASIDWRRASMWLGGVALIALAVAAWPLVDGRRQSDSVTRFALTFRPGQGGGEFDLSPDGRTLVYRSVGSDGIYRLYRRAMDQFDAAAITDTENGSHPFFSPDGQWIGFTVGTTLKKVSLAGGASVTLAILPDFPRGASWGESGNIVVGASRGGLFQVSEDGGDPTSLVSAADRRHWYPQVLSRHRVVLFTQTQFDESLPRSADAELQLLELDTGRRRTLLHGSAGRFVSTGHIVFLRGSTLWAAGFNPDRRELTGTPVPVLDGIAEGPFAQVAVSPDGSLAYVPAGTAATRHLVWVDREGREEFIGAPPRGYTYPRVSPDGTRAAIDVREGEIDIFIFDFGRRTLTPLTFDPAQDEYPVWTPEGRRVLFASFRDQQWGVFSQAADGTGNIQRVGSGPSELDPMSISPDGRTLVLNRAGDLLLLSLDQTGSISPLLTGPSTEHNAEISPNGRWIAYQSNESGRHEIYVRPFPRVSDGRWQISSGGGSHPVWARSGHELFYISAAGLVSVPVQIGRPFEFGNASVVLKGASERYWVATVGRAYDVAPDGQRFLMLKEEQQAAARIHVVQNWTEELKQRVPTR